MKNKPQTSNNPGNALLVLENRDPRKRLAFAEWYAAMREKTPSALKAFAQSLGVAVPVLEHWQTEPSFWRDVGRCLTPKH